MNKKIESVGSVIPHRYSITSLEKKVRNKPAFQEEIGWAAEPKRPILCLPSGMSDELGGKLLMDILPGLLSLDIEILILGRGPSDYGALFTQLAKEEGHRVYIVPDKPDQVEKMYAASDMALFLADPADVPALKECLRYGVVPIGPTSTALDDYNPIQESGTSFVYEKSNLWRVFAAVVRALETHRFPFDWRTIQKHCMETAK